MELLNSYRNIANRDDHYDLIAFEHTIKDLIERHGFETVEAHFAQATINECERRFIDKLGIKKQQDKCDRKIFNGDHLSVWEGANGTIFRCDEYPLSWDELIGRIKRYKASGLDGYITGLSIHAPGITFGIVAFEKGKLNNHPWI